MLTPHKKRKKYKNKFYTLPHETHAAEEETSDGARKKRERRESRERKKEGSSRSWVCKTLRWVSPEGSPLGLAGRGSVRPTVRGIRNDFCGLLDFFCSPERQKWPLGVAGSLPLAVGFDRGHPQWPDLSSFFLFARKFAEGGWRMAVGGSFRRRRWAVDYLLVA
jgi:hypothetical protein